MTTITADWFETYETPILTEQMSADYVQTLLEENPDFAEWYRARIAERWRTALESERAGLLAANAAALGWGAAVAARLERITEIDNELRRASAAAVKGGAACGS